MKTPDAANRPEPPLNYGKPRPLEYAVLYDHDEEVEQLFDTIYDALGWIEPGRGNSHYEAARKALARLRELVKP